jgi:hypothetical protein
MMRYFISAQPRTGELLRFWELLNNGTIAKQEPDGQEIIASMKRAVVSNGNVEWIETCFCSPPLNHERTTIYDRFFENMQIKRMESPVELKGEQFWDYLRDASHHNGTSRSRTAVASQVKYVPLRIL